MKPLTSNYVGKERNNVQEQARNGRSTGDLMRVGLRLILLTCMLAALLMPVHGYPGSETPTALQPPWKSIDGNDLTLNVGCTCHGDGAPSTSVVVSVSGVPRSYDNGAEYSFTITLQHASNAEGGYLFWDGGAGNLTPGEGSEMIIDGGSDTGAVGHTVPGNDWIVNWTAPSTDVGDVYFTLAGNAVDGMDGANAGDAWNLLSFTVAAPGTAPVSSSEDMETRTISVGDYDSLFVLEKDPDTLEAERQEALAHSYFEWGNIYFWTTLSILLVAAVIQGEFYERRFAGGPPHLDISLAVPQGILQSIISMALLIGFGWAWDSGQAWGVLLVLGMLTLWAGFTVYRTIVQAMSSKKDMDLV